MTDYAPFHGRYRVPASDIELVRVLWTMRSSVGKQITAGIFIVATGRELRVALGEELLESRLSRSDDVPLETRAHEIRTLLATRGWSEAQ